MATKLTQGFEKLIYDKSQAEIEKSKADDKAFADYNTKLFGEHKDAVVASAQKVLREAVPAEAHAAFDQLDGKSMSLLVAITNNLYKKYGKEDEFRGGAGAGAGTQETFEELSNQQRELMKSPAFSDPWHAEHEGVKAKNKIILDKMRILKP
jgi:hypothetical protein